MKRRNKGEFNPLSNVYKSDLATEPGLSNLPHGARVSIMWTRYVRWNTNEGGRSHNPVPFQARSNRVSSSRVACEICI